MNRIYFIVIAFTVVAVSQFSCTESSNTKETGVDTCLSGLSVSQKELLCQIAKNLKDTKKIDAGNFIGLHGFVNKENSKDFEYATTIAKFTENYLSDFIAASDLTPVDTSEANRYYRKYVSSKCAELERRFSTPSGKETKSVIISNDELYKLVNALYLYQNQAGRKTGVRVVFANYDDRPASKAGELTYFMIGTVDTTGRPASDPFQSTYQKDLTILDPFRWTIPAWGVKAYNHGELCPTNCDVSGKNTQYYR